MAERVAAGARWEPGDTTPSAALMKAAYPLVIRGIRGTGGGPGGPVQALARTTSSAGTVTRR